MGVGKGASQSGDLSQDARGNGEETTRAERDRDLTGEVDGV